MIGDSMLRIKNWCVILMATFYGLTTNYLREEKKVRNSCANN